MFQSISKNLKWKEYRRTIFTFVIVILAAFLVRFYVVRSVQIKGDSMEPNFHHNDVVIVNEIGYRFTDPKQGDVIVCFYNQGIKNKFLIKRVIGLPGDEIDFKKIADGEELEYAVVINGQQLSENYLYEKMVQRGDIEYPYLVPEDSYFVMGDHRNVSSDSRSAEIGAIKKKNILGEVVFRIFPIK